MKLSSTHDESTVNVVTVNDHYTKSSQCDITILLCSLSVQCIFNKLLLYLKVNNNFVLLLFEIYSIMSRMELKLDSDFAEPIAKETCVTNAQNRKISWILLSYTLKNNFLTNFCIQIYKMMFLISYHIEKLTSNCIFQHFVKL